MARKYLPLLGEDWGSGAWASGLRWQLTSTHNLP